MIIISVYRVPVDCGFISFGHGQFDLAINTATEYGSYVEQRVPHTDNSWETVWSSKYKD